MATLKIDPNVPNGFIYEGGFDNSASRKKGSAEYAIELSSNASYSDVLTKLLTEIATGNQVKISTINGDFTLPLRAYLVGEKNNKQFYRYISYDGKFYYIYEASYPVKGNVEKAASREKDILIRSGKNSVSPLQFDTFEVSTAGNMIDSLTKTSYASELPIESLKNPFDSPQFLYDEERVIMGRGERLRVQLNNKVSLFMYTFRYKLEKKPGAVMNVFSDIDRKELAYPNPKYYILSTATKNDKFENTYLNGDEGFRAYFPDMKFSKSKKFILPGVKDGFAYREWAGLFYDLLSQQKYEKSNAKEWVRVEDKWVLPGSTDPDPDPDTKEDTDEEDPDTKEDTDEEDTDQDSPTPPSRIPQTVISPVTAPKWKSPWDKLKKITELIKMADALSRKDNDISTSIFIQETREFLVSIRNEIMDESCKTNPISTLAPIQTPSPSLSLNKDTTLLGLQNLKNKLLSHK